MKIDGKDPIEWAVEKGMKIDGQDPIEWDKEPRKKDNEPKFIVDPELLSILSTGNSDYYHEKKYQDHVILEQTPSKEILVFAEPSESIQPTSVQPISKDTLSHAKGSASLKEAAEKIGQVILKDKSPSPEPRLSVKEKSKKITGERER